MKTMSTVTAEPYKIIYRRPFEYAVESDFTQNQKIIDLEDSAAKLYNTAAVTADMMRVHGANGNQFHSIEVFNETNDVQHILFFLDLKFYIKITNLFLSLDGRATQQINKFLFEKFPTALWIDYAHCENLADVNLPHSFRRIVVRFYQRDLPNRFQTFLNTLGKKTVQNYNYYLKRAQKDIGLHIEILEKSQLDRDRLNRIIDLKDRQLKRLGIDGIGLTFWNALFEIHQRFGLTVLLYSYDKMIAMYFMTVAGDRCEFWTTGYDSEFAKYSLGNIAGIEAMHALIERGCRRFNFLWGFTEHKRVLGGAPHPIYNLIAARNHYSLLLSYFYVIGYQRSRIFWLRVLNFLRRKIRLIVRDYGSKSTSARPVKD